MLRISCWGFLISLISLLSLAAGQNSSMTGTFCVAIATADQTALLAGLNWACGPGGANCQPIQEGQPCYVANNLVQLASYAYNDYYHKVGGASGACNFNNTAMTSSTDPSHDSCIFAGSTQASTGTNSSTGFTPPGTSTPPPPGTFTPPPPGFTPSLFSPPPPGFGGLTNATSPTGTDGTFGALGSAISLRVLYVPYVFVVMLHLFSYCM